MGILGTLKEEKRAIQRDRRDATMLWGGKNERQKRIRWKRAAVHTSPGNREEKMRKESKKGVIKEKRFVRVSGWGRVGKSAMYQECGVELDFLFLTS